MERIGLTSSVRRKLVEQGDRFERVIAYGELDDESHLTESPAIFIDIAGDPEIRGAVHRRLRLDACAKHSRRSHPRRPRGKRARGGGCSREFIEFVKLLDAAYPTQTAIKLILDNHSARISKETKAWLADQPAGRFEFIFTPKHGSWLNLVEGFFSKLARSVLRHIRVASKEELRDRIMAAMDHFNRDPVVHTWSYRLDQAA